MSRGNPYDYCPECNSQNTQKVRIYTPWSDIAHKIKLETTLNCHHCKNKFRYINGQWVKEEI